MPQLFLWGVFLLCLFGCSYFEPSYMNQPQNGVPNAEMERVEKKADDALKRMKDLKLDVEALSSKMAEMDRRLQLMSEEMAQVSPAKFEELENKLTILSEEIRYLEKDLGGKTAEQKSKIKGAFTANPMPSRSSPNYSETESKLYKKATDYYYAREYPKAIQAFTELAQQYPKGTFADNAVYWMGESHFTMGNYAKAISSYKKTFAFLHTEKGDDAQFKIGLAYQRMGEKEQAVIEFNKLLSLYPDSEYVDRTQKELSKLK